MSESREGLLLRELGRDRRWRTGEPVVVRLELSAGAGARTDLLTAYAVAAQLLGRMAGTVRSLHLSASVPTPPALALLLRSAGPLDAACARAVERAGLVPVTTEPVPVEMRILVGKPTAAQAADLWFDADGWLALVGEGMGRMSPGAPLGAITAACLTVNELFQLVHSNERVEPRRYTFSAWDQRIPGTAGPALTVEGLDLGAVNLAGAGAVAMCALWTAAAAEIVLEVNAGDHDSVDDTNLARLPFAGRDDVGSAKTTVLDAGLEGTSVRFAGEARRFEELRAPMDRPLLFAVDDDQTRATLQQLAPRLAISATTGALALTVEWSDLDPAYACISCGHPVQAGPSPQELASTFGIDTEELAGALTTEHLTGIERTHGLAPGTLSHLVGRPACDELGELARIALGIGGPTGSVAFLSWFAGALLLVELIAHQSGHGSSRPRRKLLPLVSPTALRAKDPRPRATCSCRIPFFREAYTLARVDYQYQGGSEDTAPSEEREVAS